MTAENKEALEYVVGLSKPEIIEVAGRPFCERNLKPVIEPSVGTLHVNTLDALTDFITGTGLTDENKLIIHVVDNCTVRILRPHQGVFGINQFFLEAKAHVAKLGDITENYCDIEEFLVLLNTMFVKDAGDHESVRQCMSGLASKAELSLSDDGFSQSATFSKGIKRVGKEDLPNPVMLAPYSTFPEIKQPERPFLLRLRQRGEELQACLHPVEDATWVTTCVNDMKKFLRSVEGQTLQVI
jgi:hypothetical protein